MRVIDEIISTINRLDSDSRRIARVIVLVVILAMVIVTVILLFRRLKKEVLG